MNGDGSGGDSIYGRMFENEGYKFKHDKKYVLGMFNKGGESFSDSQFYITFD